MESNEEVKKILKDVYSRGQEAERMGVKLGFEEFFSEATQQICQLFEPKADEGRLLTSTELDNLEKPFPENQVATHYIAGLYCKAQDAKTISILNSEHQKEIEEIFKEIERIPLGISYHAIGVDHYDELGNEVMKHQSDCLKCRYETLKNKYPKRKE